ncbi:MAG: phenylalanine--tRNA ligase subunit alpha [Proteobacteria bacterium]|nr:phenylalanine--tRNA ligase subunit alpha [Pseudomonadota bacterium]
MGQGQPPADSPPDLEALAARAEAEIAAAENASDLNAVRAQYLGKKGSVAQVLRGIGTLPPEERGRVGQAANAVKVRIDEWVQARRTALESASHAEALAGRRLDVTLPGAGGSPGHLHPMTVMIRDVADFFLGLGFSIEEGPEVETEYHNFDALNMPADHPARDMQDTFWVEGDHVLRTHTSPVQIRAMTGRQPPLRLIVPGRVYRHDMSPRHSPMFAQVEGLMVDEDVTFGDLKGVLYAFARHLFGDDTELRFRASYFPFTEPSAELDFRCPFCAGDGCATCSQSGWIEWGGCGMVHPQVLANCDVDPERYQGFAFGMGLERGVMLRHGLPQIRLLYDGDVRVLEQL